jgi:hypothetical protein
VKVEIYPNNSYSINIDKVPVVDLGDMLEDFLDYDYRHKASFTEEL